MNWRMTGAAAIGLALVSIAPVSAQPPAPLAPPKVPYGPPITLDKAEKVIAGAEAEARKNGLGMAIAVLDSGGNLVAFHRLDGTQLGSIRLSEGKAHTALDFRRSTRVLQDALTGGGVGLLVAERRWRDTAGRRASAPGGGQDHRRYRRLRRAFRAGRASGAGGSRRAREMR